MLKTYSGMLKETGYEDLDEQLRCLQGTCEIMIRERKSDRIKGGKVMDGLIEFDEPENLVVIGDIHGDLETLDRILEKVGYARFLSDGANKMIFLGDYIDRGRDSIGVLSRVCQLKKTFPNSIILMRGNHEAPEEFPFSSHILLSELFQRFGVDKGDELYHDYILPFFRLLYPMVIIRQRLIIVHGGLPVLKRNLQDISKAIIGKLARTDKTFLEQILWSDPHVITTQRSREEERKEEKDDKENNDWAPSLRGYGKYFGTAVTKRWLRSHNAVAVIRGHEPCKGFSVEHDSLVLTLFSSKQPYPGFNAAYLSINREEIQEVRDAADLSKFVIMLD